MMSLLRTVLSRVAAIQDEVMEVAGTTDAIHLLVLVCCRARPADQVSDEQRVDARTMAAATSVERLGRVASLTPMMACHLVSAKVTVALVTMAV